MVRAMSRSTSYSRYRRTATQIVTGSSGTSSAIAHCTTTLELNPSTAQGPTTANRQANQKINLSCCRSAPAERRNRATSDAMASSSPVTHRPSASG